MLVPRMPPSIAAPQRSPVPAKLGKPSLVVQAVVAQARIVADVSAPAVELAAAMHAHRFGNTILGLRLGLPDGPLCNWLRWCRLLGHSIPPINPVTLHRSEPFSIRARPYHSKAGEGGLREAQDGRGSQAVRAAHEATAQGRWPKAGGCRASYSGPLRSPQSKGIPLARPTVR